MGDWSVAVDRLRTFEVELKAAMPGIAKEMGEVALSYTLTQIRRNGGILSNNRYSDNPGVPAYLYKGKNATYPKALNAAGRAYIDKQIKYKEKLGKLKSADQAGITAGKDGKKRYPRGTFNPFVNAGFINWKGLRAAQGLQTSKVDLTYSGRMLQNVSVIDVRVIGYIYQAVVGGKDQETRDKLKWNRARYGDFLKFTDIAYDIAKKHADQRVLDLYTKIVINAL